MSSDFNPHERIKRMVAAIKSEAIEKSEQIVENGRQQFKIEKNKIINQQKEKIIQEYKNKLDQYSVKMRIERSAKINEARLKKMNARYELMQNLRVDLKKRIEERIKDKNIYRALMKNLIIEALIKLMERDVDLRCCAADVPLVESILDESVKEFAAIIKRECNRDIVTKITVNKEDPLEVTHKDSIGGVILSCNYGKIVCSNTLESRINLCLQESLPRIREGLFPDLKQPEKKAVVVKPAHGHGH